MPRNQWWTPLLWPHYGNALLHQLALRRAAGVDPLDAVREAVPLHEPPGELQGRRGRFMRLAGAVTIYRNGSRIGREALAPEPSPS
ncbi:hypothetical protein [Streptomyces sp. NPDC048411]|uniref:hypothetical protein n=1 Tax=Streptomyces sp. NPDC048411 TaxID=3157206 RepID=UPI003456C36D